jgi:serine/threonine-protein kinase
MDSAVETPQTLFGYDVIRPLGEGAGSTIYVVRDPVTNKNVALKHVLRKTEKDVRFIDQLLNEYEIGKKVAHPQLRKMIDMKFERSLLRKILGAAVVMELVDGQPLDRRLPEGIIELVQCFAKVAEGLGAMHKAGYIHCDLKPANILYNPTSSEVRVIDLGQACPVGTQKERIQGTPDYISPEQVKRQPVDERTDVYNFGATLYWCLSGETMPTLYTLEKGENSFLVDSFLKSPRELNPKVSESLSNFVMECVRTNPARRPTSMQSISERLEVILIGLERAK